MKPQLSRFLIPALLAATIPATTVLAQAPPQPQAQQPQAKEKQPRAARLSPDMRARLRDGRIAMIKESLKLDEAQLKLWAPVEEQIRASSAAKERALQDREQRRQPGAAAPSLSDRIEGASQRMTERAQRMQGFSGAFKPFYASLSDEQKAVAGVVLREMRGGIRGPGRRWAMHHRSRGAQQRPDQPEQQR